MSLWGNTDTAANRPKYANTADVTGMTVAEAQAAVGTAHPGWVKETAGTGGVLSVAIATAGSGYANGDAVVAATTFGSGFTGSVTTNANGAITGVTIATPGAYTQAPALTITTTAGITGTLTATVGGRAGRMHRETLVAMSSIS